MFPSPQHWRSAAVRCPIYQSRIARQNAHSQCSPLGTSYSPANYIMGKQHHISSLRTSHTCSTGLLTPRCLNRNIQTRTPGEHQDSTWGTTLILSFAKKGHIPYALSHGAETSHTASPAMGRPTDATANLRTVFPRRKGAITHIAPPIRGITPDLETLVRRFPCTDAGS